MILRNSRDNRVHFSDLVWMAKSPKHYAYHVRHPIDPTPAMRLGSLVDAIIFPGTHDFVIWSGRRQGKDWEAFRDRYAAFEIYTDGELETAKACAESVRSSPLAAPYLEGDVQVEMQWEAFGLECAGKVDVCGPTYTTELKVTNCTEPLQFSRHARKRGWPHQLVWYDIGRGGPVRALKIIGVESTPPHVVQVLTLTPRMIERAHQSLTNWTERLRQCEETGHWPGYSEAECDCDIDPWEREDDDADEDV